MIVLRVPGAAKVYNVALAADGARVAVLFYDGKSYQGVRVCDPAGGARWSDPDHGEPMWNPQHLALHPSGRYVAWGNWPNSLAVADLASGGPVDLAAFESQEAAARKSTHQLLFSPDGGELWALSRRVRRWAVGSWQPLPPAVPAVAPFHHVRLSADGTAGVTWQPEGQLQRTNITFAAGLAPLIVAAPTGYSNNAAIDPTGRLFAVAGFTNALTVWAVATARELFHRPASRDPHVGAVAFTPNGRTLLVGQGESVRSFDTATWAEGQAYDWRAGRVSCLAVAAGGLTAAAGTKTGRVVVWDLGG